MAGGGRAVIIGAGPAGLVAATELLDRTGVTPVVLEAAGCVGGISRTEVWKGNRIDIGGHRFFSKSDRVMAWWRSVLPTAGEPGAPDPDRSDEVMLVRQRLSRIYYLRNFFDYPITLSARTIRNLGLLRTARMGLSYGWTCVRPAREERSLEEFFVNRFGWELYATFFRDYTEKVWGVPCSQIDPSWGAQRVKGLSVARAVWHAMKKVLAPARDVAQKDTETSLIERFLYPKLGPGQLWEVAARRIRERGGEVRLGCRVTGFAWAGEKLGSVTVEDRATGRREEIPADWFFSSMPVVDLFRGLGERVPARAREVAEGLKYRDFITVGLLTKGLTVGRGEDGRPRSGLLPDTWIYVQEPDVQMGRIQIFNNWSPYLVADPATVWVGLEYFCTAGDGLWSRTDEDLVRLGASELASMGLVAPDDVLGGTVLRAPKTYPCYFGTYKDFPVIQAFTDGVPNLFLVGRNGMHRYNNADHSMLTAMEAVENVVRGRADKGNVWSVNTEQDYHEDKGRQQ